MKAAKTVSVADVAREAGVDPKVARARLRRARRHGGARWPRVARGSRAHALLRAIVAAAVVALAACADGEDVARFAVEAPCDYYGSLWGTGEHHPEPVWLRHAPTGVTAVVDEPRFYPLGGAFEPLGDGTTLIYAPYHVVADGVTVDFGAPGRIFDGTSCAWRSATSDAGAQ